MTDAASWRPLYYATSLGLYEDYGRHAQWPNKGDAYDRGRGWPDPVPWMLLESMVDLESGGDPTLVDPGGARGLGQIMTQGLEYGEYGRVTGSYPTKDQLLDPATNVAVMVVGLEKRHEMETALGYPDWLMASAGYFGGINPDGSLNYTRSDSYGTTGKTYYDRVQDYLLNNPFSGYRLSDQVEWLDLMQRGITPTDAPMEIEQARATSTDDECDCDWYRLDCRVKCTLKLAGAIVGTGGAVARERAEDTVGLLGGIAETYARRALDEIGKLLPRLGLFALGGVALVIGLLAVTGQFDREKWAGVAGALPVGKRA